jgi:8-oxo-(d)GTP phosphatase
MAGRLEVAGEEEALLDLNGAIHAAGGVVVRRVDGRAEVALVHRPKYDDWSFPKGKLEDGESHLEAALREVSEETGVACRAAGELPPSSYLVDGGNRKVVRYWRMEPTSGTTLRPTGEVDAADWVPLDEAAQRLTHDRDRELLAAVVAGSEPAYLVRHAKAGSRSAWSGDDRLRPLSKAGRRQAKGLVSVFAGHKVKRIVSSPAVRCVETVQPLATERNRSIEGREELAEGASFEGALSLLDEVADTPTVLCAHGDLIPEIVEHAEAEGALIVGERGWKKGSAWVLEREAGVIVRATYVPPVDPDRAPVGRRRTGPVR